MILDRYKPIEVKGEGGSGKVELCWDTRIQRRVAIKRMPLSRKKVDGTISGLAEARTGAMLSRPSIVSVYDFDTTEDEALLIMEAIEGPSLRQIIEDTPPTSFDLDIAAAILAAVGDAIEFAHENQVLHLDIKPDNILINRNGACKVTDFGVAELADAQGFRRASGGTIGYMPPEQMAGHELDERTDEFALAAVAYEILTGTKPFAGKSLNESAQRIKSHDLVPVSRLRDDVDPSVDDVLFAALSGNPDHRYGSVDEFLRALMPYLGSAARGSKRLREIVQVDDEVVVEEPVKKRKRSFFDYVSPHLGLVLGRVVAALLCWEVSSSALFAIPQLNAATAMIIALLPAVAGAVKPPFGAFIALLVNGISLFLAAAPMPLLGVVCVVIAIAWVFMFGKESTADANCALSISPLSAIGFAPLAPLLAGSFLTPKRAVGAAVVQVLLMLAVGQNTGPELLFGGIASPATWVMIIGWIIAVFVMSLISLRETRILFLVGTVVASCILLATQSIGLMVLTGEFTGPSSTWALTTIIACIAMCIVNVLRTSDHQRGEM